MRHWRSRSIPEDVREVCRDAEINAKSSLLQIVRQPDDDSMRRFAKEIATRGLNRNDAREVRRQEMGPRVVPDSEALHVQICLTGEGFQH